MQNIFNVPKNNVSNNDDNNIEKNNKPAEPVVDVIDLKESGSATQLAAKNIVKKYRNMRNQKPYKRPHPAVVEAETDHDEISNREDTINTLDTIAELQPGKNAQIAAKKITKKYKKIREAKKCKNIFRIPGEMASQRYYNRCSNIPSFSFECVCSSSS